MTSLLLCLVLNASFFGDETFNIGYFFPSNYIFDITAAQDWIYVGTSGGIHRYDPRMKVWKLPLTKFNGLSQNEVNVVAPFISDCFFSYYLGGGGYYNTFKQEVSEISGLPPTRAGGIAIDADGAYFLYENEAYHCFAASKIASEFKGPLPIGVNIYYPSIPEYPPLYAGNDFLSIKDGTMIRDNAFFEYPITCIIEDKKNDITSYDKWIGTAGKGLFYSKNGTAFWDWIPQGPMSAPIWDIKSWDNKVAVIHGDNTDDASHRGISFIDPVTFKWSYWNIKDLNMMNPEEQINCILPDSNDLWLGTNLRLLRYHDDGWSSYDAIDSVHTIKSITQLVIHKNTVWVGTTNGLYAFYNGEFNYIPLDNLVAQEIIDLDIGPKYLFVTTLRSVSIRELETGKWYDLSSSNLKIPANVTKIIADENEAWFLANGKAVRWNAITSKLDTYTLPVQEIFAVTMNKDYLWISGDYDLIKLNRLDGSYEHAVRDNRKIGNTIYSIAYINNSIWVGTDECLVLLPENRY
jgi:hypothetical protein